MPLRVELDHVARRGSGSVAATTAASLFVYLRGTTTQKNIYAAATGGTALTQPINPNANGIYTAWVEEPGRYDIVETIDGVAQATVHWDAVAGAFEAWHEVGAAGEPAFQNAWVNFGAPWTTAAFMKSSEGVVYLKGVVKNGTDEAVIFTLPAGYRPGAAIAYPVVSNNIFGRLDITAVGAVDPAITSNVFISLDNIFFRAEN